MKAEGHVNCLSHACVPVALIVGQYDYEAGRHDPVSHKRFDPRDVLDHVVPADVLCCLASKDITLASVGGLVSPCQMLQLERNPVVTDEGDNVCVLRDLRSQANLHPDSNSGPAIVHGEADCELEVPL